MRYIILLLFLGCASQNAIDAPPPKTIDVYYDKTPTAQYTEVGKVFANHREYGIFAVKGCAELMISKLQDEARKIDADAIVNVEISNQPIPGQMNRFWTASATAIKYRLTF